jgi:acetyltransferase-like isoleucine patch superfamily enzyme
VINDSDRDRPRRRLGHDWFDRDLPHGVVVGPGSWLHSAFAFVHCASERPNPVLIGRNSGIYNGTFFDLGPGGEVRIGDFCTLVGVIISVDTEVVIGDYSLLAHDVVIADSVWAVPGGCAPGARPAPFVIGENVWVGTRAVLVGGIRIGEGAVIGAGSVVNMDVPAFAIAAGVPCRIVGDTRTRRSGRPAAARLPEPAE